MSNTIQIGVIGCGYWGLNHVRVFNELPDVEVVGVCDTCADRRLTTHRRFPQIDTYAFAEELIGKTYLDAVIIATPATLHYELVKCALEHGKHVLVEKPITTHTAEALELAEIAQAHNRVLLVGHTFLFNAGIRAVKSYIDSQEVGKVYYLHATRTNLGPIRTDVNAVWDLASHDISIFDYLLDRTPSWVSAVGAHVLGNCREDVGFITLGYDDNVIGNIHVSWADPNKVREVVVVGSEMRIVFNDLDAQERVRLFHKGVSATPPEAESFGEFRFKLRDGDIVSPLIESSEPLKNEAAHFIACVRDGQPPVYDGRAAAQVVKVIEAIEQSMQQKGAPVTL
jgi:predicted dehydrogenase